jgi:putative ABC transport system permease protein
MLRTLGASRAVVFKGVAAEFLSLGLLSGVLAAAGATVAGYSLAREVFNLEYSPDPMVWIVGIVGGALLVGVAGVLAAWSAVTQPPVATLRQTQA